jgi:hypothetical protein
MWLTGDRVPRPAAFVVLDIGQPTSGPTGCGRETIVSRSLGERD